jgi:hypothetical protein
MLTQEERDTLIEWCFDSDPWRQATAQELLDANPDDGVIEAEIAALIRYSKRYPGTMSVRGGGASPVVKMRLVQEFGQ